MSERWIKLSKQAPTIADGEKVLLYRVMNDDQKLLSTTIHDTAMVKHCNPDETWWMPLPIAPCEGNTDDASTEPSINYDGVLADSVCYYTPCLDQYKDKCTCGRAWKTCDNRQTDR